MDYKFLLKRLPFIIFHPAKAWEKIHSETFSLREIRNFYLYPLILLVSIFAFTGSLFFTNTHLSVVYSLFVAIKFILLLLFVVYGTAAIHKEITYPLDLGRNFNISFKIIVYSLTPLFLCMFLSQLFDSLVFVNILALYGLYLFWVGSEKMLNPPEHKKMPMVIATLVVIAGLYIAGSWIINQLIDRIYYGYFS
jgi:hypothetical protein